MPSFCRITFLLISKGDRIASIKNCGRFENKVRKNREFCKSY